MHSGQMHIHFPYARFESCLASSLPLREELKGPARRSFRRSCAMTHVNTYCSAHLQILVHSAVLLRVALCSMRRHGLRES